MLRAAGCIDITPWVHDDSEILYNLCVSKNHECIIINNFKFNNSVNFGLNHKI